jgi:MoaA/NifB/PqqE/SkfB family radical SAM enzyme
MNYRMEADFYPLTTCNFRCPYCYLAPKLLGAKVTTHGTPEQWREGFDGTGQTWLIHVTGGEPFLYPDFASLCAELTKSHYLSINTNLSRDSLGEFVERVSPERIHFLNVSLHWEERTRKGELEPFLERFLTLQRRGFRAFLSWVMTPTAIRYLPEVAEELKGRGLFPIPKVLRGTLDRKSYPWSYTYVEKHTMSEYLRRAREWYAPVVESMAEPPTVDLFADDRFLGGLPNYRGRTCESGRRFAVILPDGTMNRCGSGERLGNLLRRDYRFLAEPKVCDTSYCPYFCEKYSTPS